MHVIVLGSGVVGTATAWYLREAGCDVTVIDRQPASGLETSFANGGQISVSHAEPWANPGVLPKIFSWLGREEAPLLWRFRADPAQWAWGARFLSQCRPSATRRNIVSILQLAMYSRSSLQALRASHGLEYDALQKGIVHIYTDKDEFAHAIPQAELMRQYGCDRQVISAKECLDLEPAFLNSKVDIVGGTYTNADESGDAFKFTQALAARCAANGVVFRYGEEVHRLCREGQRITGVMLGNWEFLEADAYVVSLGSFTPRLLSEHGIKLPIYPAKGYSATLHLEGDAIAPSVSITDDEYKLVFSRLGSRLRVAGTAEFSGYSNNINVRRCDAIVERTRALFSSLSFSRPPEYWTGLRPATPGNVPYIGETPIDGLFVNSGHGTLGWTMACGSGRLMADLVTGRKPGLDAQPYAIPA